MKDKNKKSYTFVNFVFGLQWILMYIVLFGCLLSIFI